MGSIHPQFYCPYQAQVPLRMLEGSKLPLKISYFRPGGKYPLVDHSDPGVKTSYPNTPLELTRILT